jgi:hypothetical protein
MFFDKVLMKNPKKHINKQKKRTVNEQFVLNFVVIFAHN